MEVCGFKLCAVLLLCLQSSDEKERRTVTKLLAKMFSDPDSQLAQQNKPLWVCFLGRCVIICVAQSTVV